MGLLENLCTPAEVSNGPDREDKQRERERRGGWIIIEAGVDCCSMADKCHTLR